MADKVGLQMIGWMFGGLTAAVMLIAMILVHDAVANPTTLEDGLAAAVAATDGR